MRHLKRTYCLSLFCLMLLKSNSGHAQFVPIEDTSFAAFLCQIRPSITSLDCKMLDTVAASNNEVNLYLNNRGIKKADELIYFKNIHLIDAQQNKLTSLPSLSGLRNDLESLNISYNNLTKLPGIEKLKNLKALNVSNNQFKSLPDLSLLQDLKQVTLSYNQLSFKDFLPLTKASNFSTVYSLMPQNSLTGDSSIDAIEHSALTINIPIDEGVPNVYYAWYKNYQLMVNEFRSSLKLPDISAKDTGIYVLYVTSNNPKLAGVSVNSGPIRVRLKQCQQVLHYDLVPDIHCEASSVTLNSLSLSNEDPNFESFLENSLTGFKTKIQKQQSVTIEKGNYHLIVTDGKKCTVKKDNAVKISVPASCSMVFTPNGDGFQDELFLDGSGEVHILNKEGKTIKTLNLPCYWDGSDSDGNNTPLGTYLLLSKEGTQEKITVLR